MDSFFSACIGNQPVSRVQMRHREIDFGTAWNRQARHGHDVPAWAAQVGGALELAEVADGVLRSRLLLNNAHGGLVCRAP